MGGGPFGEPLVWIAAWVVVAGVLSSFPSKRKHWPLAYVLIALGLPILVWAFADSLWTGMAGLAVGCLILRWPLRYALRRLLGARAG